MKSFSHTNQNEISNQREACESIEGPAGSLRQTLSWPFTMTVSFCPVFRSVGDYTMHIKCKAFQHRSLFIMQNKKEKKKRSEKGFSNPTDRSTRYRGIGGLCHSCLDTFPNHH